MNQEDNYEYKTKVSTEFYFAPVFLGTVFCEVINIGLDATKVFGNIAWWWHICFIPLMIASFVLMMEEDFMYVERSVVCRIALLEEWDCIKVVDVEHDHNHVLKKFKFDDEADKIDALTDARLFRDKYYKENHKPSKYID